MELVSPQMVSKIAPVENCGGTGCGCCPTCRRKAAISIAAYVIKKRFTDRGRAPYSSNPEEQRYVRTTILKMLAVAGLLDEKQACLDEIKRSEWGTAMRQRQTGRSVDS